MHFFSETYHESTQYAPRSSGDPIALHWETVPLVDKRYEGSKRYPIGESKRPLHEPVLADGLQSVDVYAVIRGGEVPDGVYYYDKDSFELVKIGNREVMEDVVDAFPEKETVKEASELYLYVGRMGRSVWHFREAAYRQVEMDVGAACANTMLFAKSRGKKVFVLGGFVDDSLAIALKLTMSEIPLAAVAVFPENSMVAFNSLDDGVGEFAYSNRSELLVAPETVDISKSRYPARFLLQNRGECINDVAKCVKVRRVVSSALPGDEFPLTPAKFPADYYFYELWYMAERSIRPVPFKHSTMDLDDFSSMLRWLELGSINAFGAGLLKIWVLIFDVMFIYAGVYRYVPVRKSIYMQSSEKNEKKFAKCFSVPEQAQNASFAVILTANLNEACGILGERAYRYLNLNAGYMAESLGISGRLLNKNVRMEHFFYQDELKKYCSIPEEECVFSTILVGKNS